MKKLYYEYFYIPENGKIREKVMLVRIAITVAIMIACLAAMSFAAYAYFSCDVTTTANTIKSADYDVLVTFDSETEMKDGCYLLKGNKEYAITLEKRGSASTGFCIVEITIATDTGTETLKYHTQQLDADGDTLNFTLDLSGLDESDVVTVKFTPHWGTSKYYQTGSELYIEEENVVKIPISQSADLNENPEDDENPEDNENPSEPSDPSDDKNETPVPDTENPEVTDEENQEQ